MTGSVNFQFPEPSFYPLDAVDDSQIRYAVIVARYQNQWIFCRHRDRKTWELPGGHREPGESPLETARRELWEETGATDIDIDIVGIYRLFDYGLLCFAEVKDIGILPIESEIAEICLTADVPQKLTYSGVHDRILSWVIKWLECAS